MRVTDPETMSQAFADAFNAGDLDKLLSLYETQAIYVTRSHVARGAAALRGAFAKLLAVKGTIALANEYCHTLHDIALVRADWRFKGVDATGRPIETRGRSSEVLRRQHDGSWLYAIDHPLGGE